MAQTWRTTICICVSSGGGHISHNVVGLKKEKKTLAETQKGGLLSLQVTSWQPENTAWNKTTFVSGEKNELEITQWQVIINKGAALDTQ